MKRALLVGALAVGLGAMALTRGVPPAAAPPERVVTSTPPAKPVPLSPPLLRNPFEFATRRVEPVPAPVPPSGVGRSDASSVAEPAPPPVRLVGFVQRGDGLKAVLVVEGETVVLAQGESVGGYTVMSVDEAEGVRLTAPDRSEIGLSVPE